ncbi:MAG: SusC/RagA family TonB-linked outer membrane protein [Mariniphaga sp.]
MFLLVGLIQVTASTYSSSTKLTLELRSVKVSEVLDAIESQSEFRFAYSPGFIDLNRQVSIDLREKTISESLNTLFAGTGVKFAVHDRHIMLYPAEMEKNTNGEEKADQQRTVTGQVTDNTGQPLPGVTIVLKGTTSGTISDVDGNYALNNVPQNATLVFSFVGMQTQEIAVDGQSTINVSLNPDAISVDEVVVVGYGTMQKREVTSSITSVGEKELIPGVSGNPLIAMQDKVTGLSIQSSNGTSPNAGTSVQLRGVASVLAGQGPLVVIDGVPGGSLNSVSREDIQSIDILKDASAGAIYGTRAAGGVILITTKQAKEGRMRLTYTSELSTETIRRKPDVLSAEEFVANGLGQDYGHVTDWYDEVTVDYPFRQRHHVNLSGGSATSKIYATFVASDQEGIAIGDSREEMGGRINANFTLLDGFAEIITHADYRTINSERSHNGIFNQALKLNPTLSPYDDSEAHGLNVWTGGWEYYNPVADILLRDDTGTNNYFLGDATLKLKLTRNLSTQAMVATRTSQWRNVNYQSAQHKTSLDNNRDGYASQSYGQNNDKTFEWLANYLNDFNGSVVSGVIGYSFQEFNGDGFNMNNANFPVDGIKAWDMGKGTYLSDGRAGMGSWKDPRTRLIAFFARGNFSYNDKYMLTVSGRYEGSSKFYKDNQWGLFPAVSGGWRISSEPFMQSLGFIDDLKLRAGYGVVGNQSFAPGVATRMYSSDTWWLVNGDWIYTYGSRHNQNKDLQWEEKKELNLGVDFSFFDNRLSGKVDVYDRTVDKMIYDISVSVPPAVHDKTTMNVGSLKNTGWEAELTYNVVRSGDTDYSTTIRASQNKSVLENLWGSQTYWDRVGFPAPGSPGTAVRLYPGEEIGKFFVWRHAGFTEDGNWMLYDEEGNAFDVTERTKTNDDKAFVGNAIPKLRLSMDHSFRYRNWEMNAFFTSWIGHDVFNTIEMYYGLPNVEEQNVLKDAFEKHKDVKGEKELSDYWIQDADFLKLKALTVRYNFDVEKVNFFQAANVYVTGRDLFTLTKYSGMDPESNINGLDPGFEWHNNIYPRTRTWTLGVQLSF